MAVDTRTLMARRWIILALAGATACGPRLAPAVVRGHPSLQPAQPRAVVLKRSAEQRPAWLLPESETATQTWQVVGQGRSEDLPEAEAKARDDLLRAIAELVAVQVEYEHQSIDEQQEADGQVEARSVAHEEARARSQIGQVLRGAAVVKEQYWEQVSVAGRAAHFRAFVVARIDRQLLEAARLEAQLEAVRARGRKITVLRPASGANGRATFTLIAALERRILHVPSLSIFGSLPPPLEPDLEIVVAVRVQEEGHLARYQVIDRRRSRSWSHEIRGPSPFALEDRVAEALLETLGERR